jgi:type IV pilus assembly protein PilB
LSDILSTHLGSITYLALTESPDEPGALAGLNELIDNAIAALDINIAIDLANVKFLSSSAMEILLDANDKLKVHGGWLKVANSSKHLRKIFEISGFDRFVGSVDKDQTSQLSPDKDVRRLGDVLLERNLIDPAAVRHAMEEQQRTGKRLGQVLIDSQLVPEADVLQVIGEQLGTPFVSNFRVGLFDPEVVAILPREAATRLNVVPLFKLRNTLSVALSDCQDIAALDEIEERSLCRVRPVLACRADIQKILVDIAGGVSLNDNFISDIDEDLELVESAIPDDYSEIDEMSAGSPIINLVNAIIQRAVLEGVSDIPIEPGPTGSRVRFRVDSILYEVMTPRAEYHPAIVSRLKIMANLDIAERRMPQDGRIQVYTQKQNVDLRFSSLPGLHGEKVVLRVLDKRRSILDLNKLGFSSGNLETFKDILTRSYGLILVTGPTGSGKTTSLYAGLSHLNSLEKNIVTVEDPVEYQLEIINQNEVRDAIGLSFSKMLKHILRQDPDIVMVGEIREKETAKIAVQAALTGHLVLSTLHTNDSVSAVTRMIDMGVEPYLLSSALVGVVAQRLVRTICPNCKTYFKPPPEVLERYQWEHLSNVKLATGRGCSECFDSGYKGRIGIHEILTVDAALQSLIMKNPSRDDLNQYAKNRGLKTLFNDGLEHVLSGETTLEEVSRVISN